MPPETVLAIHEYEGHRGLAAVGLGTPVLVQTISGPGTLTDLLEGPRETVLYLADRGEDAVESSRNAARDAGFDWNEFVVPRDAVVSRSLRIALELAVRCARSRGDRLPSGVDPPDGTPSGVDSPESVANASLEALAVELLSHLTVLEGELPLGRRERSSLWTVERQVFETVRETLGLDLVDSSSKYRPDTCPDCGIRWDVVINGTAGFDRIASFVWKCEKCSRIVDVPMTSNRTVAKR